MEQVDDRIFDTLTFSFYLQKTDGEYGKVLLIPELKINNELLTDFVVDTPELVKSISASGEFFIFTCGCGDSGCAGIDHGIIVVHDKGVIKWFIPDPISNRNIEMDVSEDGVVKYREHEFEPDHYKVAIAGGIHQAQELIHNGANSLELCPYGFEVAELLAIRVDCF